MQQGYTPCPNFLLDEVLEAAAQNPKARKAVLALKLQQMAAQKDGYHNLQAGEVKASLGQLAARFGMDKKAASRVIDGLLKAGLLVLVATATPLRAATYRVAGPLWNARFQRPEPATPSAPRAPLPLVTRKSQEMEELVTDPKPSEALPSDTPDATPSNNTFQEEKTITFGVNQKPPRGRKRISLRNVKPEVEPFFDAIWNVWPKRSDGKPSRGNISKAETCFQAIVDSGVATPQELLRVADSYIHDHPNVQAGYVQMVATFFALQNGTWKEGMLKLREQQRESA